MAHDVFLAMKKIARYRIEKEIGRGQMGVVYLARDPQLDRPVAVKTCGLPPGMAAGAASEYEERFLREARAAAGLSHPGIVTVYDAGVDAEQGLPYIAMEHVAGASLRELLAERGRLDPKRALPMVEGLARALAVAHEAGIVHRDLKPANILVRDTDGAAKIADFGVARIPSSELTRSGSSLGSPAYMSPEQIRCEAVDHRSDLFSLAVVLYEALCGERPFAGDDPSSLAYSIVHETPLPISRRVPGLPAGLDAFFHSALATDAGKRFQSGEAFAEALAAAAQVHDLEATVVDGGDGSTPADLLRLRKSLRRRPRRRRIVAASALILALLLVGWLFFDKQPSYLILDGKSAVPEGHLTLEIDEEVVYSRDLAAPNPEDGFLKKVLSKRNNETFEAWLEVKPGRHEIAATIATDETNAGYRDTIVVELEEGETRRLRMVAGRAYGSPLTLKLER